MARRRLVGGSSTWRIQVTKASSRPTSCSRTTASVRLPSASKCSRAPAICSSGEGRTRQPGKTSIWRSAIWLRTVPQRPGVAPMIATGLFCIARSGAREAQSSAFLSTPDIE